MKILIIIPAFNEAGGLQTLLPEVQEHCSFADVLVIDDGSTDQTSQIATQYGIKVIKTDRCGIGRVMLAGYTYAAANDYSIAVQVDGDGQHDPRMLKDLIQPVVDGKADCAIGSRYMKPSPDRAYKTPILRRIGMYYSSFLLFLASGMYISDTTSGFRAVNEKALKFLATSYPVEYPEAGTLLTLMLEGFRVREVPTKMRARRNGLSMYTFTRSILYPFHLFFGLGKILLNHRRGQEPDL